MESVHVRRLAVSCRIPTAAAAERERVRRLWGDGLEDALDAALAHSGIAVAEEICIRAIDASVRVWLGQADMDIVAQWAATVAGRIRDAIDRGEFDTVVRFPSRVDAVIDALRGLARDARGRAWAWRQLDLPVDERSPDVLAEVLCRYPDVTLAALNVAASDTAVARALRYLNDDRWMQIASAALSSTPLSIAAIAHELAKMAAVDAVDVRAEAQAIVTGGPLARLAAGCASNASVAKRRALATMLALSCRPVLFSHEASAAAPLVASIVTLLESPALDGTTSDHGRTASDRADDSGKPLPQHIDLRALTTGHQGDTAPESRRDHADEAALFDRTPPLEWRRRATTEWGGLLFLVHLLAQSEEDRRRLEFPALASRSLQWTLHRLALLLVPTTPDDPAVLAFAGLPPVSKPPDDDAPPTSDEEEALVAIAHELNSRIATRLEQPESDSLLFSVCARRAEVVADPGWFDIRFSLASVSIEIRRAGLDLDPGYVPWLGVILKFSYV